MESTNRAGLLSWVVNTGPATAITVDGDGVVVVIEHLPDPAETPERLGQRRVPATMIHLTSIRPDDHASSLRQLCPSRRIAE